MSSDISEEFADCSINEVYAAALKYSLPGLLVPGVVLWLINRRYEDCDATMTIHVALGLLDLISDCLFAASISPTNKCTEQTAYRRFFYPSCAFIFLPLALNLILTIREHRKLKRGNEKFQEWRARHCVGSACFIFFGFLDTGLILIMDSQIFKWDLFKCPMPVSVGFTMKFYGSIKTLLEDVPQLVIQGLALYQRRATSSTASSAQLFVAQLSFFLSLMTVAIAMLRHCVSYTIGTYGDETDLSSTREELHRAQAQREKLKKSLPPGMRMSVWMNQARASLGMRPSQHEKKKPGLQTEPCDEDEDEDIDSKPSLDSANVVDRIKARLELMKNPGGRKSMLPISMLPSRGSKDGPPIVSTAPHSKPRQSEKRGGPRHSLPRKSRSERSGSLGSTSRVVPLALTPPGDSRSISINTATPPGGSRSIDNFTGDSTGPVIAVVMSPLKELDFKFRKPDRDDNSPAPRNPLQTDFRSILRPIQPEAAAKSPSLGKRLSNALWNPNSVNKILKATKQRPKLATSSSNFSSNGSSRAEESEVESPIIPIDEKVLGAHAPAEPPPIPGPPPPGPPPLGDAPSLDLHASSASIVLFHDDNEAVGRPPPLGVPPPVPLDARPPAEPTPPNPGPPPAGPPPIPPGSSIFIEPVSARSSPSPQSDVEFSRLMGDSPPVSPTPRFPGVSPPISPTANQTTKLLSGASPPITPTANKKKRKTHVVLDTMLDSGSKEQERMTLVFSSMRSRGIVPESVVTWDTLGTAEWFAIFIPDPAEATIVMKNCFVNNITGRELHNLDAESLTELGLYKRQIREKILAKLHHLK
eukprot:g35468.t1